MEEAAGYEDSADEDYVDNDEAPTSRRRAHSAKSAKSSRGKRTPAKRPRSSRRRSINSDSDDDEDLEISMNESIEDDDEYVDDAPKNARGLKKRRAAIKTKYRETDNDELSEEGFEDQDEEEEEEEGERGQGNGGDDNHNDNDDDAEMLDVGAGGSDLEDQDGEDEDHPESIIIERKSLILSIPTTETGAIRGTARILSRTPATATRTASKTISAPPTIATPAPVTRSSARAASVDVNLDMLELTSSGRHSRPARQSTRSPERLRLKLLQPKEPEPILEEDEIISSQAPADDSLPGQGPVLENEILQFTQQSETAHLEALDTVPAGTQDQDQEQEQEQEQGQEKPATRRSRELQMLDQLPEDYVPESQHNNPDDDDDEPLLPNPRRSLRRRTQSVASSTQPTQLGTKRPAATAPATSVTPRKTRSSVRNLRPRSGRPSRSQKRGEEDDDFKPDEEGDDDDDDDESERSAPRGTQNNDESDQSPQRRLRPRGARGESFVDGEGEAQELAEEVANLAPSPRRRLRPQIHKISYETKTKPRRSATKKVDYRLFPSELPPIDDEDFEVAQNPTTTVSTTGGPRWKRQMFSTYGPFGGAGGGLPLFGDVGGMEALGGADSDSSDDEFGNRKKLGSAAGLPGLGAETVPGVAGTVANLGKIKDRQSMADNDPLGVDQNVNFDSVGGLQGHIDKLKEMVSLPLLYPEIFQKFHLVPPRGVLFHGPPGTGKTLLARALASSLSSEGKKVTFYMRKGADALSKWVGEAERQLRLLFEDARKNQPSIIFFDEIDGLAPVRSSKQEQIHASIVSTLLALMDGMDGRGQVIVIGATNRPDSVDPALRRPGRFDREFYFPLPNVEGRRAIIDIHTRGWQPPVPDDLKDKLAEITKGYGGADLRALCTEAALNAVQRRYPQIYRADKKLLIDPAQIHITPRDFMISTKNIVPSSERSSSSAAAPLPPTIEPLLKTTLLNFEKELDKRFPRNKTLTALEEAQYEQPTDQSFGTEILQQAFQTSRFHRPTMLIRALVGQGAHYIGAALLNHLEGVNIQSFDLPTLLGDSTRSPEATLVQLFAEVKRRKPSVIYLPDFARWEDALGSTVIATFNALLRSIKPSDPILLLGLLEQTQVTSSVTLRHRFGFVGRCEYHLSHPSDLERRSFFQTLVQYIRMAPSELQDPDFRKKRDLEALPLAPVEVEKKGPSKDDLKATKKKDRQTLNLLKIRIQPIMDQIKKNYRRFRTPAIDEHQITYLFEEENPNIITSDLPLEQRAEFRPFEKDTDKHGVHGLREVASGKFFYNLDITTIEKRLSNGYYKRPSDFLADIKRIAKDARQCGDYDRQIKGNELLANVEVDIGTMETTDPAFVAECENVYTRELEREKLARERAKLAEEEDSFAFRPQQEMNVPPQGNNEMLNEQHPGPIVLGESFDGSQRPVHASDFSTPTKAGGSSKPINGAQDLTQASFDISDSGHLANDHTNSTLSGFQADVQMSNHDESNSSNSGQTIAPKSFISWGAPPPVPYHGQRPATTGISQDSHQGSYGHDNSTGQAALKQDPSNQSKDSNQQPLLSDVRPTNSFSRTDPEPNFSLFPKLIPGDSRLPNTQAEENLPWSYQPTISPGGGRAYADFNNTSTDSMGTTKSFNISSFREYENVSTENSVPQSNQLVLGEDKLESLLEYLVVKTTAFDVEQLETVHAELVQCIWEKRGEWNRNHVIDAVHTKMEETYREIQLASQSQRDEVFT
ncbi:ATPase, AAA-type, core [Ascosphaera apis ARSEF 7405]|uniref:ATPase, AAA-type, core n=1 Tax=Ascosphaera apis ARSEF 7405 TaxID=392613 RepID=A0A167ZVW3_9EURO|nr:ATPase, AAA-type, core [Ascosphaera apis ARSEF 7405]